MSAPPNPYAPPAARVEDVLTADSQMEATRREHLKHEASVRSVGTLYLFGCVMIAVAGLTTVTINLPGTTSAYRAGAAVGYAILAGLWFGIGSGLRKLRPWTRVAGIIASCLGLLAFPIGTVINAYILYLLLSAKGKRLFAPDYGAIVAATPHLKYRTPTWIWVLLGLLLLAIVAALVLPQARR